MQSYEASGLLDYSVSKVYAYASFKPLTMRNFSEEVKVANEEHLAQLMKGTPSWNLWRRENWSVKPDLSKVNLSGINLQGAFLSESDLRNVNFGGANLSDANINQAILDKAIFDGANLYRAGLSGINLQSATFGNANLEEAVLSRSKLINVDLSQVRLRGANLQGTELSEANLNGVDLSCSDLSWAKLNAACLNGVTLLAANLHKADLRGADLRGANLKYSDLSGAFLHNVQIDQSTYLEEKWFFVWKVVNKIAESKNLRGLDLTGVNFSGSDLSYVDLRGTNLSEADLSDVNFSGANLSKANLFRAILNRAIFLEADLSEANLMSAQLFDADLAGRQVSGNLVRIDLKGADLSRACLFDAHLIGAKLFRANLGEADLRQANLTKADLFRADLSRSCLEQANLIRVQAIEANFTEARMTGACLEDWSINQDTKLDGVICDYVYKKSGQKERRPRSDNFASGEFTALFQKAIETVDLIFIDGVDWQAFFQSFQELRKQYGEKISIQAIEKKSGDAFIIRLEVAPEIDKIALEEQHRELYVKLVLMQEKVTLQDEQLIFYRDQLAHERQRNSEFSPIIQTLAENQRVSLEAIKVMTDKEHSRTIHTGGGNYIETNSGTYIEGNFINMSQDLSQAASQIQDLIEQLQNQGATVDVAQEKVANGMAAEAKKNPTMKDKLLTWGQSLGSATVNDVVKGAVKLAIRSAGIPLP